MTLKYLLQFDILIGGGFNDSKVNEELLSKLRKAENLTNISFLLTSTQNAIAIINVLTTNLSDITINTDLKEGDLTALSNALRRLINLRSVDLYFNFKELSEVSVREKIKPVLPPGAELVIRNTRNC